jgi:hypothetical protein
MKAFNVIPTLQPEWMAKGQTLAANWARKDAYVPANLRTRYQANSRQSVAEASPTKSRKASNAAVRPYQSTPEEPNNRRKKSGIQQQSTKPMAEDSSNRVPASSEMVQLESVDPAIISSSLQAEDSNLNSSHITKTEQSSPVDPSTKIGRTDIVEKSSGYTGNAPSTQQLATENTIPPTQTAEAPSSPSTLDGAQDLAAPSNNNSPKKNKSKAKSSKKLSVSENKKGEAADGISCPEQNMPNAQGKKAAGIGQGKKANGCTNAKPKDRKVDPKIDPAKGSSSSALPVTTEVMSEDQVTLNRSTSAANPKSSQRDAKLESSQKHASFTSGFAKRGNAENAMTNGMSKTAVAATDSSKVRTRGTSTSTYDGGASTPSYIASTAATSLLHTERSNSIAEDLKPSELARNEASVPGVDPDLLRNKLEDKTIGLGVTRAREEPAGKDASTEEGQSIGVPATAPHGPANVGQRIVTSVPDQNQAAAGQMMSFSSIFKPGQVGQLDPENLASQNPQAKGTSSKSAAKAAKKAAKKAAEPRPKVHVKMDVKPDAKSGAEGFTGTPATRMTGGTHNIKQGSGSLNGIDTGQADQQKTSEKTLGKTLMTIAANVSTPPSPSAAGHRSPERKQPPQVPERLSSLAVLSTPIETRKRKAKVLTPTEEEAKSSSMKKEAKGSDKFTADEQALVRK